MENGIYTDIYEALQDPRSVKMIINGYIDDIFTNKYIKLSKKMGIKVTEIHDPQFKGDTGLIVISDDAVDIENITTQDREKRLEKLDIPADLTYAAGKKVCEKCYNKIIAVDPNEKINYEKIDLGDRFWGTHCAACNVH